MGKNNSLFLTILDVFSDGPVLSPTFPLRLSSHIIANPLVTAQSKPHINQHFSSENIFQKSCNAAFHFDQMIQTQNLKIQSTNIDLTQFTTVTKCQHLTQFPVPNSCPSCMCITSRVVRLMRNAILCSHLHNLSSNQSSR